MGPDKYCVKSNTLTPSNALAIILFSFFLVGTPAVKL